MLRSIKEIIGCDIQTIEGETGKIEDIYFDTLHWRINYLVISTGSWYQGKKFLLPPEDCEAKINTDEKKIITNLSKQQIQNAPDVDAEKPVSRRHNLSLRLYYKWPIYWKNTKPEPLGTKPDKKMSISGVDNATASEKETDDQSPIHSFNHVSQYRLKAIDGDIGVINDALFDEKKWSMEYIVAGTYEWLAGKEVLIHFLWVESIEWHYETVTMALSRTEIKNSPEYEKDIYCNSAHKLDI